MKYIVVFFTEFLRTKWWYRFDTISHKNQERKCSWYISDRIRKNVAGRGSPSRPAQVWMAQSMGYLLVACRGPAVVAYATVAAATMCVKAPDYLKDILVRAKLLFEGFDNATQPQKPHRESVRPVFALCHEFEIFQTGPVPRGTTLACTINFMHTIQMFRAHLKSHARLSAFFLTKETPTHERIAVQNICMRSTSRLGEICSEKRLLTNTSSTLRPFGSKMLTPD